MSRFRACVVVLVAATAALSLSAQERPTREETAARLKRLVDERLAEFVTRLRDELHREIDAALAEPGRPPKDLDTVLRELRPERDRQADRRDAGAAAAAESLELRLRELQARLDDLSSRGASPEVTAPLRARLATLQANLEGVHDAGSTADPAEKYRRPAPDSAPQGAPPAPTSDEIMQGARREAMRSVLGGAQAPVITGAPESRPAAPATTSQSQKYSQFPPGPGVGSSGPVKQPESRPRN